MSELTDIDHEELSLAIRSVLRKYDGQDVKSSIALYFISLAVHYMGPKMPSYRKVAAVQHMIASFNEWAAADNASVDQNSVNN